MACSRPAVSAAWWPKLRERWIDADARVVSARRSSSSGVRSELPSLTSTSSKLVVSDGRSCARDELLDELLLVVHGGDDAEQGGGAKWCVRHRLCRLGGAAEVSGLRHLRARPKPSSIYRSSCLWMPSSDQPQGPPHQRSGSAPRRARPVVVQFVKFGIVGVSNTLLTFAVYTLLLKGFGVWYLAASAIGFMVGATNGFLLNRRWTFRGHVGDSLTPVRWAVVQALRARLNVVLLYVLVHDATWTSCSPRRLPRRS